MVAHLYLRFDEALHLIERPLDKPLSEGGYTPGAAPKLSLTPLLVQTGRDNETQVLNRLPKTASVDLSGYRQAGKWVATFDYRDFPVDPRLCRAVGVEMHLGTVRAEDFARGMVGYGGVRFAGNRQISGRTSVLETRVNGVPRTDTMLIFGLADNIHSEWSSSGAMVTLEGRDLRGVMLDAAAKPELLAKLKLSAPLVTAGATVPGQTTGVGVVNQILAMHPFGVSITIEVNPDDWPDKKIPSPADAQGLTRVNLGAGGATPALQPTGDPSKLSIWDIITNYCAVVGAVPYFVGKTLYVRPARSLYDRLKTDENGNPAFPTPFAGGSTRVVEHDDRFERLVVREVVYGKNIESLEFERKLGGIKAPQVKVVCLDTSSENRGQQRLRIATYPKDVYQGASETPPEAVDEQSKDLAADSETERALKNDVSPGGMTHRQVITFPVHGIKDQARLDTLARELHEEIARGEMGGKVSTRSVTSFGGDNLDPDLLGLRPGDPVKIMIDARALGSQPPLANAVTDTFRMPFLQAVAEFKARLGDENLARVLVATARNQVQELQSFFRVNNVHFGWDSESGVEVQFDFQNYLEARYDLDPQKKNQQESQRSAVAGLVGSITTSSGGLTGRIY